MQSLILLLTLAICCFASVLAIKKNRSPFVWFFLTLFLGIISVLILVFLDEVPNKQDLLQKNQKEEPLEEATIIKEQTDTDQEGNWFFLNKEKQISGPFALPVIYKNIAEMPYPEKTWLWKKGMKGWQRLEEIPEALEQFRKREHSPTNLP